MEEARILWFNFEATRGATVAHLYGIIQLFIVDCYIYSKCIEHSSNIKPCIEHTQTHTNRHLCCRALTLLSNSCRSMLPYLSTHLLGAELAFLVSHQPLGAKLISVERHHWIPRFPNILKFQSGTIYVLLTAVSYRSRIFSSHYCQSIAEENAFFPLIWYKFGWWMLKKFLVAVV